MESQPLVSVVIPSYKRSDTVRRAIESVQKQTYSNIEIWVVDDNGDDDKSTKELLKVLKGLPKEKSVNYLKPEKHVNGSFARNEGIKSARGEYIAFLDDDDIWYPTKIEKQMEVFRKNKDVGLVYCGAKAVYPKESISYCIKPSMRGDLSKEVILGNFIATTSAAIVKKDILEKAGMFDVNLPARQDYDLWVRVAQICKIDYVDEILIDYMNERKKGQVTSNTDNYVVASETLENKYKTIISSLSKDQQKLRKRRELVNLVNRSLRNGNKISARKYVKEMFKKGMIKYSFISLCMSFINYETLLKMRSKRGKGLS